MDISTQRTIDRIAGTVICGMFSIFDALRPQGPHPTVVRNILVIFLSEMGSLTLAYPMIQRLKEMYPNTSISILTFERNKEIIDILGYADDEKTIVIRDNSFIQLTTDSLRAMRQIRRADPEVVIDGELFSRISSIYAFLSGAPVKVGFDRYTQEGLYRGSFINRPVLYNPYLHIARQFINLAEAIRDEEMPKSKRIVSGDRLALPVSMVTDQEKEHMGQRIQQYSKDVMQRPIIVLHPGGGLLPIRAWPPEYYATTATALIKAGFSVVVTGPKDDFDVAEKIVSRCDSRFCLGMTGVTTSIRELLVVFSLAQLLITNDGGPGHFAGLTATPSIIIYGPETPKLYGALNENAVNLSARCACSPCLTAYNHRRSPCNGNNLCLKAISPEMVLGHAWQLLKMSEKKTDDLSD